jgi:hypothetical protein
MNTCESITINNLNKENMKILKNTLALFLLIFSLNSAAQTNNPKLDEAIKKGLGMIAASKDPEAFIKSGNYFERISLVETEAWLPPYYAAYSHLIAGIQTEDKNIKDKLWDKALLEVEQANNLSPENSEIYALKGYLEYMKLSIDPQSRLSYMGQSASSLAHAKKIDPENPRIYLINGQNKFYTPEAFGGGKANAKPILETAVVKFAIFKAVNPLMPDWGSELVTSLLAQCN